MLSEINGKVVSYCEIPEELTSGTWLEELSCDCYVKYTLTPDMFPLDKWICETYPELT